MDLAELKEFLAYAARARSLLDRSRLGMIENPSEIYKANPVPSLEQNRPGALTSKLLFAFTRYTGLGMLTVNMVVAINGGWSHDFCHAYMYTLGLLGTAHTFAVQGALLLRIYVIYSRSLWMLVNIVESKSGNGDLVDFVTVVVRRTHSEIPQLPPSALSFETYLCALVLVQAFKHRKSSKRAAGAKILSILIRDSFIWYLSLAACLWVNAVAWTTNTPKLVVVGVPSLSIISTVGGSRLLLNVRAVYFSSIRNPSHPGHSDWLDTEGTVGRFWSPGMGGKCDNDDDGDRECAASISMGVWSNEDVQRNRPPSPEPPVIILQPVPPGRKRFFRPPPRPALFGPASEQGAAASSSGLSMGPEGDGDEVSQSRSVISVAHSTDPQASSSMIGASTQQTEDPDVEEGTPGKG
ncbi:hypothetical protein FRC04_010498 [Tulasnella sp. 424]|nr:hypothetical protein FRC04_010498 [Tulasnella sp. 424]